MKTDARQFWLLVAIALLLVFSVYTAVKYDVRIMSFDGQIWLCDTYNKNIGYYCTNEATGEYQTLVWSWGWPEYIWHEEKK